MTWSQVGWVMIALAVILLAGFSFYFNGSHRYQVRKMPAVNALLDQRVIAIERGRRRQVILGDRFLTRAYPALGLHALSVLPNLVSAEDIPVGGLVTSAGAGELVLFAQQIVQGRYRDGFSTGLQRAVMPVTLPGPTPLAFLAGLLPEVGLGSPGSLAIFGSYGESAPLWVEAAAIKGGHVFAAAGSITAQAGLFLAVRDLLIGEEVFMLPGLIVPTPQNQAGWISEDILRSALIVLLLAAVVLKMVGVL